MTLDIRIAPKTRKSDRSDTAGWCALEVDAYIIGCWEGLHRIYGGHREADCPGARVLGVRHQQYARWSGALGYRRCHYYLRSPLVLAEDILSQ